jgi:hypothetical protein
LHLHGFDDHESVSRFDLGALGTSDSQHAPWQRCAHHSLAGAGGATAGSFQARTIFHDRDALVSTLSHEQVGTRTHHPVDPLLDQYGVVAYVGLEASAPARTFFFHTHAPFTVVPEHVGDEDSRAHSYEVLHLSATG